MQDPKQYVKTNKKRLTNEKGKIKQSLFVPMSVKNPRQSNDEFEKQDFYKNQIFKKSLPYNKFFFFKSHLQ